MERKRRAVFRRRKLAGRISLFILFCLGLLFPLTSVLAANTLNKSDVERLFQKKLENIRALIVARDKSGLSQAAYDLTQPETIVLLEFSLRAGDITLPSQKAYFNREPFLALFENADLLDGESFKVFYRLDQFQPQFGGRSAIINDSAVASGNFREPFSGNIFKFSLTQKCRNTISAHAKHMFVIDSIYCRMNIDYSPLSNTKQQRQGVKEAGPTLEKPPIADIMSEIENKKSQPD